ncbi:MAG: hypothetical protein OXD31_17135 [Chloroflexi bacterium]|nr:hypothetical protein [Chloroflexota bacterium]
MTEIKVPVSTLIDWISVNCPSGHGKDGRWIYPGDAPEGQTVRAMVIHDVEHASGSRKKIGRWQLWLFAGFDTEGYADRRIDLGNTLALPTLDDAIIEAVRLGAIENGHTEDAYFPVLLNFTGRSVIDIPARSPEEAMSLARHWGLTGRAAFFENLRELDKDHDYDNISVGEPIQEDE